MKRLLVTLMVLSALPSAAQDTTTLDGEPAIRIMAGHGHLNYTYCEGQLWITATRLRFDSFLGSEHSFDLRRAEVKDFHAAHLFGFDYMKVDGGGHTYRLGIYPNLEGDFGDRFAFAEKAWKSFDSARAEVERTAAGRKTGPGQVSAHTGKDGAMLEFRAFAGPGVVWFRNEKAVTIWANERAGREAYGWILGKVTPGRLQVTAERVRFLPDEGSGGEMSFDAPRSEVRIQNGAGGYPRLVVNVRELGRLSLVLGAATGEPLVIKGKPAGNRVQFEDVAPLLRALGPGFPQMAVELLPPPVLVVTSEPGAEVFVDEQRRGVVGADRSLRVTSLAAGNHSVRLSLAGRQPGAGNVMLEAGEEKRIDFPLAVVVVAPVAAPAKPAGPAAFSLQDVVAMLQGGVSPRRVGALVSERGVDFALDNASEQQVRAAGGDAELLVVIAKSKK